MTLIAEAQRLEALAQQAQHAGDASVTDAALREVLDRLEAAKKSISYGIAQPEWLGQLSDEDRASVSTATGAAAEAVRPFSTEQDEVLAAYAMGKDAENRGTLGQVSRTLRGLANALQAAQDSFLSARAEAVWATDRRSDLEVHALDPETQDRAVIVREVLQDVDEAVREVRKLPVSGVERFLAKLDEAAAAAASLGAHTVPSDVRAVFDETESGAETTLDVLSVEALEWLRDHGASGRFLVRRAES